ncbi:MAG: hypothetical protein ABMA64_12850 [Myxococcota bacterium]
MIAALLVGCGGADGAGDSGSPLARAAGTLVAMDGWTPGDVAVAADPYAPDRPVGADCPPSGYTVEGSSFEVNTGSCTWAWFQQPAAVDLIPGDVVEIVFWHSVLVADGPATGHLALSVGDAPLFEATVDIPHDPAAYTEVVEVPFTSDPGDVVTLHLHNHGANTWNLLRVERQATGTVE